MINTSTAHAPWVGLLTYMAGATWPHEQGEMAVGKYSHGSHLGKHFTGMELRYPSSHNHGSVKNGILPIGSLPFNTKPFFPLNHSAFCRVSN